MARLLLVAGMMGMFFFLTQFLQDVLGFSPISAGVAFLPMTVALFAVSRAAAAADPPVFGPQRLMIAGMLPVIAGMAWLSQVSPATSYWSGVFGPMLLFGVGMGVVFVPLTTVSLAGVRPRGLRRRLQHGQRHAAGRRRRSAWRCSSRSTAPLPAAPPRTRRRACRHVALQHQVLAHGMSDRVRPRRDLRRAVLVLVVTLLRARKPAVPDTPAALVEEEIAATAIADTATD